MAINGRAEPKIHNPTLYIYYLPLTIFIMDACPSHIFESTKGIGMNLGL